MGVFGHGRRERELQAKIDAHVEWEARQAAARSANLMRVEINGKWISIEDTADIEEIIGR